MLPPFDKRSSTCVKLVLRKVCLGVGYVKVSCKLVFYEGTSESLTHWPSMGSDKSSSW